MTSFEPPPFKPAESLVQLKRSLREMRTLAERGSGFEPTIAESFSSGCTGFIKAAFGLRFEGVFLAVVLGIDAD